VLTDNLLTGDVYSIRARSEIATPWAKAHIPLVATEDIAQAAFERIVGGHQSAKDVIILGPEALTYDEVCSIH
jgi:festuclavine dehydrogenase